MLSLLRVVRFVGSNHGSKASTQVHSDPHSHSSDHNAHEAVHDSHSNHDSHGHDGHVGHSHKKIPEGSWHRHSDDEDIHYWYDRYGPFHTYSLVFSPNPGHSGETPNDEIYRHEIQGYIRQLDVDDVRRNSLRGILEGLYFGMLFLFFIALVPKRNQMDDDYIEKRVGDALLTAQEIEIFIEEAKKKLH